MGVQLAVRDRFRDRRWRWEKLQVPLFTFVGAFVGGYLIRHFDSRLPNAGYVLLSMLGSFFAILILGRLVFVAVRIWRTRRDRGGSRNRSELVLDRKDPMSDIQARTEEEKNEIRDEWADYVPDPIIISEERKKELREEHERYIAELFEEIGEPQKRRWRAPRPGGAP